MRFTAAKIGLQFDDRIATSTREPLCRPHQQVTETFCQIGSSVELDWIGVFQRSCAVMNLVEISSELCLLEITRRDVLVRFDHFSPG